MSDRDYDAIAKSGTLGKYLRAEQLAAIADRDGAYKARIAELEAALAARSSHPDQLEVTLDEERLARAIHFGRLDNGEWLCGSHSMPEILCPAAPHRRHARAILAALADTQEESR